MGSRFEIRRFESIDSTNSYLMGLGAAGAPAGIVAVTDFQTAGRGRLDRRWETPAGSNLLMSVLLRPDIPPDQLFLCPAAVGLAGAAACEVTAGVRATSKWPNDLLVETRKIAGVLAESAGEGSVVVGIGLNVTWPGPPDAGGTCLAEHTTSPPSVDAVFQALLSALEPRLDLLESTGGRGRLLEQARASLGTLGSEVVVDLGSEVIRGRATALMANGQLEIETHTGDRRGIVAGDVVHLRPAEG